MRIDLVMINRVWEDAPEGAPEFLETSDWMEGLTTAAIDHVVDEYETHFDKYLQHVQKLIGPPESTTETQTREIAAWYPEAVRAACWRKGDKVLCLALEHPDRDAAVGILLKCYTQAEIDELSGWGDWRIGDEEAE